jgi:hypothetical protein
MKTVRMTIDIQQPQAKALGRIDTLRVDATTDSDIDKHNSADDSDAMSEASMSSRHPSQGCTHRG